MGAEKLPPRRLPMVRPGGDFRGEKPAGRLAPAPQTGRRRAGLGLDHPRLELQTVLRSMAPSCTRPIDAKEPLSRRGSFRATEEPPPTRFSVQGARLTTGGLPLDGLPVRARYSECRASRGRCSETLRGTEKPRSGSPGALGWEAKPRSDPGWLPDGYQGAWAGRGASGLTSPLQTECTPAQGHTTTTERSEGVRTTGAQRRASGQPERSGGRQAFWSGFAGRFLSAPPRLGRPGAQPPWAERVGAVPEVAHPRRVTPR